MFKIRSSCFSRGKFWKQQQQRGLKPWFNPRQAAAIAPANATVAAPRSSSNNNSSSNSSSSDDDDDSSLQPRK